MWAFGHTHFDCQFYEQDVMSGKNMLVLANQKGYASPGGRTGKIEAVVVESGVDEWKVIMGAKESKIQESRANRRTPEDAGGRRFGESCKRSWGRESRRCIGTAWAVGSYRAC